LCVFHFIKGSNKKQSRTGVEQSGHPQVPCSARSARNARSTAHSLSKAGTCSANTLVACFLQRKRSTQDARAPQTTLAKRWHLLKTST